MKISLNWLKNYIAFGVSPKELAHKLTLSGLEVEKEEVLGEDTVFELEITPNRPDCLNYIGMAREISAILNKPLKKPAIQKIKFPPQEVNIKIESKKDCSRYIGIVLEDVNVKACPCELAQSLLNIGLRSVNNIVDITNFCLMETGQPMHAFDFDKLEGKKIIVRRAKKGEHLIAIDGNDYALDPSMLIIADAKKPVAIAGVMGGKETEVTQNTKNILLESAYFDPTLIRQASRKLSLRSDSSYRFERGVDMDTVEQGAFRAINLFQEMAGGKITAKTDAYSEKQKAKKKIISVSQKALNKYLGTSLAASRITSILKKLEFRVSASGDKLKVVPPSFRGDVNQEVDVIEEVARVVGYDNLPLKLPEIKATNIPISHFRLFKEKIAQTLCGKGLCEAISYTMTSEKILDSVKIKAEKVVGNQNPLTEDQRILRPSSLPNLLQVIATNIKRGQKDIKLFEIGKNYFPSGEKDILSVVVTGKANSDWRTEKKQRVDFYDIKGILETVFEKCKISDAVFKKSDEPFLAKGEAADISLENNTIGFVGKINPEILSAFDIKHQDVYFAEMLLAPLFENEKKFVFYQTLCDFPAVTRDISLAIKQETTFQEIKHIIVQEKQALIQDIGFIEQYLGEKLPENHRGVTLSLTYQAKDRTLTDNEVDSVHLQICEKIISSLNAIKR